MKNQKYAENNVKEDRDLRHNVYRFHEAVPESFK